MTCDRCGASFGGEPAMTIDRWSKPSPSNTSRYTATARALIGRKHLCDECGVIVLEYVVTKIGFTEVKDTDVLNRVHTLKAGTAVIIDREVVAEALDAQALKIERAKGVERLPLDGNGDGEGDDD